MVDDLTPKITMAVRQFPCIAQLPDESLLQGLWIRRRSHMHQLVPLDDCSGGQYTSYMLAHGGFQLVSGPLGAGGKDLNGACLNAVDVRCIY